MDVFILDPDFRTSGRISMEDFCKVERCLRCEKPIIGQKHAVTVNWANHSFVKGHHENLWPNQVRDEIQQGFLGSKCYERQIKEVYDMTNSPYAPVQDKENNND